MAEKPEDQFSLDEKISKGKELYARGCRNYYVKSYSEAADDLSDACKFYSEAYGVDGDELGDVYLLYAKALVAVGQEENKLIEVPENEDEDEPVEEDDGENNGEEKMDEGDDDVAKPEDAKEKPEEVVAAEKTNGSTDPQPGPSTSSGEAASTSADTENVDSNETNEENAEEDGGNLEVAWEVLQNAALIFQRQEEAGLKKLLDVYSEMANISMENGNFDVALDDFNRALNTFSMLDDDDQNDRIPAEIHYKIGLCETMIKKYDDGMKSFEKASDFIAKVIEIEKTKEQTEEILAKIKDLEETQQEIKNKILEISDVKAEEIKMVKQELAKLYGLGTPSADGAGPSGSSSSSTMKSPESDKPKPTDISHLIKRKKPDSDSVECSPAKKQVVETSPGQKVALPVIFQAESTEKIVVEEESPSVRVAEGV